MSSTAGDAGPRVSRLLETLRSNLRRAELRHLQRVTSAEGVLFHITIIIPLVIRSHLLSLQESESSKRPVRAIPSLYLFLLSRRLTLVANRLRRGAPERAQQSL